MQGGDANEILYIMWNTITGRRTSVPELWTKSSWSKSETDGWRPAWNGWSTWDEWSAWNGSSTGNVCKNKVEN